MASEKKPPVPDETLALINKQGLEILAEWMAFKEGKGETSSTPEAFLAGFSAGFFSGAFTYHKGKLIDEDMNESGDS